MIASRIDRPYTAAATNDLLCLTCMRRLIDDRFVFDLDDGKTRDKDAFVRHAVKLPMVGRTLRDRIVPLRDTCAYIERQGRWQMPFLQIRPRSTT